MTSSLAASAARQKCIKATLVANRSSQTDRTSNREKTKQKQETRIKTYRLYFRVYVSLGLNTPSIHDRTSLYHGGKKKIQIPNSKPLFPAYDQIPVRRFPSMTQSFHQHCIHHLVQKREPKRLFLNSSKNSSRQSQYDRTASWG